MRHGRGVPVVLAVAVTLLVGGGPGAHAQPPAGKVVRVGYLTALGAAFEPATNPVARALLEGLRDRTRDEPRAPGR